MIRAAVIGLLLARAGVALAAAPACFPERTVLEATPLIDAAGRPIGTIRGGQRVTVVADRIGADGAQAEIAISAPIRLRAFVARDALRVFLRQDFAVEPDRTWWTAGTPLQVFDGNARAADVRREEANRLTLPQALRCSLLAGTVDADRVVEDPCHCQVVSAAREARAPVWWEDPPSVTTEIGRGYPPVQVETRLGGDLIARNGSSVLVEFVDFWNHVRVRRWVEAAGMKMGDSGGSIGRASLCLPSDQPLGQRGGRLGRAVPLGAVVGAEPFTQLPAGTEYRVLQVASRDAKIVARWPAWSLQKYTVDLRGWVPAALLPAPPDTRRSARAVAGRVVLAPGVDPKRLVTLAAVTRAAADEKAPSFRAQVGSDGRFVLPVETMEPARDHESPNVEFHRVEVTSPSGDLIGVDEDAPALPGGAEEVVITVGPPVEISGRVESRTGARIPGEPLQLMGRIANASTRSDADGRFRFLVPPGRTTIESADDTFTHVDTGALPGEVVVRQRRRPSVFGSVPKRSDGRCIATRVNARIPCRRCTAYDRRSFPVDSQCHFTADDLPREVNDTTFTLDVPSSPEALRSTYPAEPDAEPVCFEGACPPGVPDASVFVELADAAGLLVTKGEVEARVGSAPAGTCRIEHGHCYLHHLAPGSDVHLASRSGGVSAHATVHVSAGVNEVLLRPDR